MKIAFLSAKKTWWKWRKFNFSIWKSLSFDTLTISRKTQQNQFFFSMIHRFPQNQLSKHWRFLNWQINAAEACRTHVLVALCYYKISWRAFCLGHLTVSQVFHTRGLGDSTDPGTFSRFTRAHLSSLSQENIGKWRYLSISVFWGSEFAFSNNIYKKVFEKFPSGKIYLSFLGRYYNLVSTVFQRLCAKVSVIWCFAFCFNGPRINF